MCNAYVTKQQTKVSVVLVFPVRYFRLLYVRLRTTVMFFLMFSIFLSDAVMKHDNKYTDLRAACSRIRSHANGPARATQTEPDTYLVDCSDSPLEDQCSRSL